MAYFLRLIAVILFSLPVFLPNARADTSAATGSFINTTYTGAGWQSSAESACKTSATFSNRTYKEIQLYGTTQQCYDTNNAYYGSIYEQFSCPAGSTRTGTSCTYDDSCASPTTRQTDGTCSAPPVKCSSDFTSPTVRSYTLDAGVNTKALQPSDIPAQSCIAGCAWQTQGAYSTFTLADGSKHIEIGTRPTGVACSTTDSQPAQVSTLSDTKKDCLSKGNSFGQINGIDICLKSGTPSSATVGAKSDVQTKSSVNGVSNGDSSSSSASTVNGDGSVTTNITNNINNPDGTTTKKQDSKTEDKQTFCQENPTSKICLDDKKSTFTGACPQSTCDGDAIQCAIAKRQQQDACDALNSKDLIMALPAYGAGQELLQGKFSTDVQGFIDGTDGNSKTVNLTTDLSESGKANFSGEGMTDITFSVMGITRTLPLSNYNKYLQYMGYILLALAYVSALKIVMGSVA